MSLKKEFLEFLKTKPVEPFVTLPNSGIDVEWSELLKAWKIDMGMDVTEFLTRNPDIKQNIITRFPNLEKFLQGKITSRTIMKRGLAEAILNEMIQATDVPNEADRVFKGQRLRNIGTGTLSAADRDALYENAQRTGQLPERTTINPEGGVRQTSKPQKKTPKRQINQRNLDGNRLLDPVHVPEDIAARGYPKTIDEMIDRGLNVVEDETGKLWKMKYRGRVKEQIFNGKGYKFERTDYSLHKTAKKKYHQKTKRLGQGIEMPLSSIEQMMADNINDQITRLNNLTPYGGIELEHKTPLSRGGVRNHPAYLGAASYDLNNWKSDLPRDIPHIPFGVETIDDMESLGYIIEDGKWKAGYPLDEMFTKVESYKEAQRGVLNRGIGGIKDPTGQDTHFLRTYDPNNPIDVEWAAKEKAFLDAPGREPLRAASEASGGLKNALRKAGSLLPVLGAGMDAWDVQQRYEEMMNNPNEGFTDWLDKAQFSIASATLGTSFWAEPANFALGMTNLGIDAMRTIFEKEKRDDFGDMLQGIGRGIGHVGRLF